VNAIPGATVREQAVLVAGILAELSVQELEVVEGGQLRRVRARETDLPGVLESSGLERVECTVIGVVLHRTGTGLVWSESDAARAREFRRALSPS
jgi:hypothetical protein